MTPTGGEITVLGEEYGGSDWRELRKRIGVVSASISHLVHDEDAGLEIVAGGSQAMIGYWGKISRSERERARRFLSLLRVPQAAERSWEVLSQGERQRVLIARALMADPVILILDEPCAGLDPVARERFLNDISKLAGKKQAPALVLVTHHIEEIVPEFTHVLALRRGRIAYSGPKSRGLEAEMLATVFNAKLVVRKSASRYHLRGISWVIRCSPRTRVTNGASPTSRARLRLGRWTSSRCNLCIGTTAFVSSEDPPVSFHRVCHC